MNIPLTHIWQASAEPFKYCPARQPLVTQAVRWVEAVAPADVPVLIGQESHAAALAVAALKVSAAQGVIEPPEPVWPASATHAPNEIEPVVLPVPELLGQPEHGASPVMFL